MDHSSQSRSKLIGREPCPECTSSGRDRSGDNLAIYDDGHKYCYACNYYEGSNNQHVEYTYEFLPLRGISRKTLEFYNVRTKIDPEGKPIDIVFPYPDNKNKIRSLEEKAFRWQGDSKPGLFGRDKFAAGSHKYVTITEGEIDALSLYEVLGNPVVSVRSSSSARMDCSAERSWLSSYEVIYLAFDADGPGRQAAADVARLFDYNRVKLVNFDRRKDANEYLEAGEVDELRNLWHNARHYLPETVVTINKDTIKSILNDNIKPSVSYPFKTLNEMTFGIRTGESVLLTAQEGVGKTEIMRAIEHHLLRETTDAIGAIFLEEPKRRHLLGLAGLELSMPVHLPDTPCTDSQVADALEKVCGPDDRLFLYSHFGSDDPEILLDTIRFMVSARNVRYVLLDHVSMVVSGLAGEDERRALDYISTRLEMMVKELDFALIMVSHVNDFGQTRGSRYISKVADIRVDVTRDLLSADLGTRNTSFLTVSKNRFSGRTGPAGSLVFDPVLYKYTEVSNDNEPMERAA